MTGQDFPDDFCLCEKQTIKSEILNQERILFIYLPTDYNKDTTNPYPFIKVSIQSMISEFLQKNNEIDLIHEHGLESFDINVLEKHRTLIEKIVSLIRFSFDDNYIASISSKVRHFYDIYYLLQDLETLYT